MPPERGGLVTPTQRVPIGYQDLDHHIIMDSIPGPSCTDLVSIKILADDSDAPANPHLTDPLGPDLL